MNRRRPIWTFAVAVTLVATPLVQIATTELAHASGNTTYTPGTVSLDTVENGPWTLSQGDPNDGAPYADSLPTYTPGAADTQPGGLPNLAVYPQSSAPPGPPYATGMVGTPGVLPAYCTSGGAFPETGTQAAEPANTPLPMSPYYFPFVEQTPGDPTQGHLTGYFDYRPKDTEEAVAVATSTDGGQSWNFVGKALEQNPESYCPAGDTNDNGQGHSFVMTVGGNTYLYTVNRPSGDNAGVGLLIHSVNPTAANPVSTLPTIESVGIDNDAFAFGGASLSSSGGGVSIATTTAPGSATQVVGTGTEQITSGQYEDLNASSPLASLITCTGASGGTLTGCTTANGAGLTVASGDPLVAVLADASSTPDIPFTTAAGGVNASETGGVSLSLNAPLNTITVANVPGRFYIDGATIYCINVNSAGTQLQNCTTTQTGGVQVTSGAPLTSDPILPADSGTANGAQQTNGLIAPDGIVGTIPATSPTPYPGAPSGSTVVIYGEKILNYYIEGTTTTSLTLPASTITFTPSGTPTAPLTSGSNTIYLGSTASSTPQTVTCTAYNAGTHTLTGCSGGTGTVASGNDVGGPGAAIAPWSVLAAIGEGGKSAKPASLFKNNEDLTVLRAAYTTDGVNFTDLGQISGSSGGASNYDDVNNPSAQGYPSTINLPQGATDTPELRFVGTRGTIIVNPDGSLGMFDSGAWESDGDSDAFDQVFYSSSTDGGLQWSEPTVVESTDYTFSARQQQDAALAAGHDDPLGISAYFAGRTYSPTVVQNPDGTLTLVFSGYSTPKPIPLDGSVLGDGQGGAPTWTVSANDPALYRNILTVTLTPNSEPGTGLPEAPATILLPVAGLLAGGGAVAYVRRRGRRRLA
jgi:hypothetical protein